MATYRSLTLGCLAIALGATTAVAEDVPPGKARVDGALVEIKDCARAYSPLRRE